MQRILSMVTVNYDALADLLDDVITELKSERDTRVEEGDDEYVARRAAGNGPPPLRRLSLAMSRIRRQALARNVQDKPTMQTKLELTRIRIGEKNRLVFLVKDVRGLYSVTAD
jgi:hypothetical protein